MCKHSRGSVGENELWVSAPFAEGMAVSSKLSHSKLAGKENTEDCFVVKLPVGGH